MSTFLTSLVLALCALGALAASRDPRQAVQFGATSCQTPRSQKGECRNIRQCEPLLSLLRTQRKDPAIGDFLRASVCGYEGNDPQVCCPVAGRTVQPTPTRPAQPTTTRPARPRPRPTPPGPAQLTITPSPAQPDTQEWSLPSSPLCGFSNYSFSRVVGGSPAKLDNWPWMAALGYKAKGSSSSDKAIQFLCGGSLISERHVLTAGHCVHNRLDLTLVRLGDLDLESDNDGASPFEVAIAKRQVHEEYSSTAYTSDIALLTLARNVPSSSAVHPICLPSAPEWQTKNLVGYTPFIAGWGTTSFNGPSSSMLQELQIPVVDEAACVRAYRSFRNTLVDGRVICAGYVRGGRDACRGDSGGPLMLPLGGGKHYYVIGVVSFGFKCAEPGIPGVYTRVTAFMDWIQKNAV